MNFFTKVRQKVILFIGSLLLVSHHLWERESYFEIYRRVCKDGVGEVDNISGGGSFGSGRSEIAIFLDGSDGREFCEFGKSRKN